MAMELGAEVPTLVPLLVSSTARMVKVLELAYGAYTSMSIRPLMPLIGIAMKWLLAPLLPISR